MLKPKKKEITEVSVIITVGNSDRFVNNRKLKRITKKKTDFPKEFQSNFPGSIFNGPYERGTALEFYLYKKA